MWNDQWPRQQQRRRLSDADRMLWKGTLHLPRSPAQGPNDNDEGGRQKEEPTAEDATGRSSTDQQSLVKLQIPDRWTLLHIPKTAGDSFMRDTPNHLPLGTFLRGNHEESLARTYNHAPILTLLREPTSHVLSQYLECKYDRWAQEATKGTGFPGMGKLDDVMGGFDEWIQHFVDAVRQENYGDSSAFHCYDPYNMQSRYLAADRSLWRAHVTRKREDRFPSVDVAKENLLNKIHLVGIVKHYAASLCLLEYHAMGGQLVTPECQVCNETTRKIALATSGNLTHEKHSVPPHSIDMISNKTRASIEREMTLTDQEIYRTGLELFEKDVDAVYKATGVDLLCRRWASQPPLSPLDEGFLISPSTTRAIPQVGITLQCTWMSGLLGLLVWVRNRRPSLKNR